MGNGALGAKTGRWRRGKVTQSRCGGAVRRQGWAMPFGPGLVGFARTRCAVSPLRARSLSRWGKRPGKPSPTLFSTLGRRRPVTGNLASLTQTLADNPKIFRGYSECSRRICSGFSGNFLRISRFIAGRLGSVLEGVRECAVQHGRVGPVLNPPCHLHGPKGAMGRQDGACYSWDRPSRRSMLRIGLASPGTAAESRPCPIAEPAYRSGGMAGAWHPLGRHRGFAALLVREEADQFTLQDKY